MSVTRSVPLTALWPLEHPAIEADTLPDGAIWIRVNAFDDPTVVEVFDRALGDAAREGPRHRGLIIDLREWQLRVTVTRDAFPDGKEFMRTGIVPDFPVETRVDDVLAGRDAVLDRARAYLTEMARR